MRHLFSSIAAAALSVIPLLAGSPMLASAAELEIPNEVKRGGLVIYKYDGETRESAPQGGGDLAGATFTITNNSANPIVYIDEFGHKHEYAVGESWEIKTKYDEKEKAYIARTPVDGLPIGTYHVQETGASPGYGLANNETYLTHKYIPGYISEADRKWADEGYDFKITEGEQVVTFKGETDQSDTPGCYNPLVRGGIEVIKRDHDLRRPTSQGNATLEGAVFEIYNHSDNDIVLWDHFAEHDSGFMHGVIASNLEGTDADENGVVKPGGKVATITTGEDGRAQTFMDALPAGWYKVVEVKAPNGYALEKPWFSIVEIDEDDWDTVVATDCDDPILRGGVEFYKYDAELGLDEGPQGDAGFGPLPSHDADKSVKSAIITIYNESDDVVWIDNRVSGEHANGAVKPGDVVTRIVTDYTGYAKCLGLPYGHYRAVEESPSTGYLNNNEWEVEFDIDEKQGGELTADGENIVVSFDDPAEKPEGEEGPHRPALPETVIKGNIIVGKSDWETGTHTPQGGASIAGAELTVYNHSLNKIKFGDKIIEPGEAVTTVTLDETGIARIDNLPYGTYIVRETKAPEGYIINDDWRVIVKVREQGVDYDVSAACEDTILNAEGSFEDWESTLKPECPEDTPQSRDAKLGLPADGDGPIFPTISWCGNTTCGLVDKVSRNDIRFNKVAEDGSKPMGLIPFKLTSKTTGEWHILVTDANGIIDTTAWMPDGNNLPSQGDYTWKLHSHNTNANDEAYNAETGEVDETKLTSDAGYYFFGTAEDTDRDVLDFVSALPYDTYTLEELRVEGNKGTELISRDIVVKNADNDVIDLGTITNDKEMPEATDPVAGTKLYAHKSANPAANAEVKPGSEITYTIDFENYGVDEVASVRVRDYLPAGTTFVSAEADGVFVDADASANGRAYVEWTTDALASGAKGSVSYTVKVASKTPKSIITNQAHYTAEAKRAEAGNVELSDPRGRTNVVYHTTDGTKLPASLSAVKTVEGAENMSANVGDVLTYKVTITNEGATATNALGIHDVIPTGTELMSRDNGNGYDEPDISDGGYTVGSNAVAWNIDSLAPGKSATVSFKVKVTDRAFGRITNQATFGTAFGPVTTSLSNTTNMVETAVVKNPELEVAKSIDTEGDIAAGQIVTYTIDVTNKGLGHAEDVVVTDMLPEHVQLVADSISTEFAGQLVEVDGKPAIQWTVPRVVRDGGKVSMSFKARVMDDAKAGSLVSNMATATIGEDAIDSNRVDSTIGDGLAGMKVEKTSNPANGERIAAGDEITYTVSWANEGDMPVFGFGIRDLIPENTTFVPGSIVVTGADGKTSVDIESEHVEGEGESKPEMPESKPPVWVEGEGSMSKTDFAGIKAVVTGGDKNKTIEDWDNVMSELAEAKPGDVVYFTVTDPDAYDVRWRATVGRDGNVCLAFCIQVPGIADGPDAGIANGVVGNFDRENNAVYAVADVVKPGETGKIEFKVKVADEIGANTRITNVATYGDGLTGMPVADLERKTAEVVHPVGEPKLVGTKTVDKEFAALDSTLTYTIEVTNEGDGLARDVAIFDRFRTDDLKGCLLLPESVKVEGGTSAEDSAEMIRALTSDADHVAAIASELPAGETMRLTFSVIIRDAKAGDTLVNKAFFGDEVDTPSDKLEHETNEVTTTVSDAKLSISAVSDPKPGTELERGDTVTYTFSVTNTSKIAADGVAVRAEIPELVNYVEGSATDGLELLDGGVFAMTGIHLDAGETRVFSFKAVVSEDIKGDANIQFRATTGFADDATLPLETDSNEVSHAVSGSTANLSVALTANPETGTTVKALDEITYTIAVTNSGNAKAKGVAVNNVVPAHTELIEDSLTGLELLAYDREGNPILGATDLEIAAGETITATYKVKVADELDEGTAIVNRATTGFAESAVKPLNVASNDTVHTVTVEAPHLVITSSANPKAGANVKRGDAITYTVRVTNDGRVDAEGVAVNTVLDKNTIYVADSATNGMSKLGYSTDEGREVLGATGINIAVGETVEFSYKVLVNDDVEDGTIISNRATTGIADSAMMPLPLAAEEIKHGVTVEKATLSIKASSDPTSGDTLRPESVIHYNFVVENTSKVDAHGVAVNANVPEFTSVVEGSERGITKLADDVYGATGINIAAGKTAEFGFDVVVDKDIPANHMIQFRATTGFADDATKPLALDSNELQHNIDRVPPKMAIDIKQDPASGEVAPGDTITYTVTVENIGDSVARKVGVYEIAPNHTTYVDGSLASSDENDIVHVGEDGLLTIIAGDMAPEESVTMTYQVVVDLDYEGVIHNKALWVSPAADPGSTEEDTGAGLDFDFGQPDEDEEPAPEPEPKKLFGIFGTKLMGAPAVRIPTEPGASHGESEDAAGSEKPDTGEGENEGGNDKPETPEKPEKPEKPEGEEGDHKPGQGGSTNEEGAGSSEDVTAQSKLPTIELVKSVKTKTEGIAAEGEMVVYTITATNVDEKRNANAFTITDKLPEGLKLSAKSLKVKGAEGFEATAKDGVITVSGGKLAPGESVTLTFKAKVTATNGTTITNVASWALDDGKTHVDGKDSNACDIKVGAGDIGLRLGADVVDGAIVKSDTALTYELTITNYGDVVSNPVITDKLPAGFVLDESKLDEGIEFADGVVTIHVTELAPGASVTYKLPGKVAGEADTVINNKATWVDETLENVEGKPMAGVSNDHEVTIGDAGIELSKTADVADGDAILAGSRVTYTITARGIDFATKGVRITDVLPEGMSVDAATLPEGAKLARDGRTIAFAEMDMPTAEEKPEGISVSFDAILSEKAAFGDRLVNIAEWSAGELSGKSNAHEVVVAKPALDLTLSSEPVADATVRRGDTITYTLTAKNPGPVAFKPTVTAEVGRGMSVDTDKLPEGVEFMDNQLEFKTDKIAVGDEMSWTYELTVNDDVPTGERVEHMGMWSERELTGTSNTVGHTIVEPKLAVEKVADVNGEAKVDDVITYTVSVKNIGDVDATAKVADKLPAGLEYVESSLKAPETVKFADGSITGTITVAAGETVTITYQCRVTSFAHGVDEIVNDFTAKVDGGEDTTGSATIEVAPAPAPEPEGITVSKVGLSDAGRETTFYVPGEAQDYRIEVKNGTDADVPFMVVEDMPGEGLTIESVKDADGREVAFELVGNEPATDKAPETSEKPETPDTDKADKPATASEPVFPKVEDVHASGNKHFIALIDEILNAEARGEDVAAKKADFAAKWAEWLATTPQADPETSPEKPEGETKPESGDENKGEDASKPVDDPTKPAMGQGVRFVTGKVEAGKSVAYTVRVKVSANAIKTVTNVANVYSADLTTPTATATCELKEAETIDEEIKKGTSDLPTTGIALGAIGLVGAGITAAVIGARTYKASEEDSE